ncbi:ribosome small subunit-dependent GTPase A [Serpentinimonas maccroryi]|uniref:ribosome small subunit-dependent GTPase A n=1 Tax=Serpentinimonas maccroryi TaxID=1458426 RepID=UPI0020332685|nr:ribosome small subunit-dependent GTPase A [Serpentinimonas maccroryi]MCM2478174.1 ribosome small subunit-dependent GTPase A [Serpentinimonas maccroryi]
MRLPASGASGGAALSDELQGLVVGTHGRHCWIETDDGRRLLCHLPGRKDAPLVGDRVCWQPSGDGGSISRTLPRRNVLYRQDELRTKSFAANLDLVLVLLAADPVFSESQLNRALVAAAAAHIDALVVLNKLDLGPAFDSAWQRLAPYRAFGQDVLPLCLHEGSDPATLAALRQRLEGRTTLVLGPSGTGKSTLINRLIPSAMAATGAVSRALNSGRHTTTSSSWYWLDGQRRSALIDSPGFQEFGLRHLEPPQLAQLMPDLAAHCGQCRFYNCTHLHEPGCAVRAAVGLGVHEQRYRLYVDLHRELSAAPRY